MSRLTPLVLLLAACGPEPEASLVCGEGTFEEDGACIVEAVDVDDPTIHDVLDALPDCEPVTDDGAIDLATGCVDGGCAGMTLPELEDAWGTATCETTSYGSHVCAWSDGYTVYLDDEDEDGQADDGSTAYSIYLESPFVGGTTDGLGPGASLGCFVEALGKPDTVWFWDSGLGLKLIDMDWYAEGVGVSDWFDKNGDFAPDGYAESMSVSAPSGSY